MMIVLNRQQQRSSSVLFHYNQGIHDDSIGKRKTMFSCLYCRTSVGGQLKT